MKKLLVLISMIICCSSINAQYQWIERKYDKPITELSEQEFNAVLKKAKIKTYVGLSILTVDIAYIVTMCISIGSAKEALTYLFVPVFYTALFPLITIPFGIAISLSGANRIAKLKQFRKNNPDFSGLTIQPSLRSSPVHNTVAPGFTICYRF